MGTRLGFHFLLSGARGVFRGSLITTGNRKTSDSRIGAARLALAGHLVESDAALVFLAESLYTKHRSQQVFALAGILAFTDKMIDRETANKIRRVIEMTQAVIIFEEEKHEWIR